MGSNSIIPLERIEQKILLIRGQKVMLDRDLAELYGVKTKAFNQAVRRNLDRFPSDFMFELTAEEYKSLRFHFRTSNLRSQIVTSSSWGGRRYRPLAFSEQGVAMLSSVLRSERAVQVNIAVVRAFVKLRELLATHRDLARKLAEMEKNYDVKFKIVFDAIRELMAPPARPPRRLGFR